jgi:hypothetical protein
MTYEDDLQFQKDYLAELYEARKDILVGRVRHFSKCNTSMSFMSLQELTQQINETKSKIFVLEDAQNLPQGVRKCQLT